jgi:hypothetical protein
MNRSPKALAQALVLVGGFAGLAGCSGQIGSRDPAARPPGSAQPGDPSNPGNPSAPGGSGTPGTPGSPGTPGTGNPGTSTPSGPAEPGTAPLRRLTVKEYTNTVRDLLGTPDPARGSLSVDQDTAGFTVGGPVSTVIDASRLLDSADSLSTAATMKIASMLPCPNVAANPAAESACAKDFIQKFGRRAFRRPLDADEVGDLMAVYTSHRDPAIGSSFPDAMRSVVAAMLSSPFFLYRAELGSAKPLRDGAFVRFNPWEVASRLSYSLWATMPDDALFAEAEAGRLSTPAQIEEQARRMLKDPRIQDTIADFHRQWLEIDTFETEPPKDAKFKEYTPQLVSAMMAETRAFVNDLFVGPQATGSLEKFFTSTTTTVDPALAKLYGVNMTGTGPQTVMLNPKERAGILTQAGYIAMHSDLAESHPVRRGAAMMRRVFCTEITPPANMDVGEAKPPAPNLTTRERYADHALQPCATCHRLTDPIGFAFENYDAIGAYRATEQGKTVDASGVMEFPSGAIKFQNAVELSKQLPQVKEVQTCMATQWLRYMLRRNEFGGDQASLQLAADALGKSSNDMREMLVALITSRAFTHRTPSQGEVLQ